MKHSPPRLASRFLEWFCPTSLYEGIEGDMFETFEADVARFGPRRARWRYTISVIKFFRPGILFRNKFQYEPVFMMMLKNYVRVASRNMLKRKLYSFINAFGLSVAIAFCTLIYLYVKDEQRFDQFHVNKENIYRLHTTNFDLDLFKSGSTSPYSTHPYMPGKLGEVLLEELSEVQHMTRFVDYNKGIVRYGDTNLNQSYICVDSGFFKMFSFEIIAGNKQRPFSQLSDAVLTSETARKYFGDEDPVGKVFTLEFDGKQESFTVSAIIETPPGNSSLNFEMLIQLERNPWFVSSRENWRNSSYPTFVQLAPGSDTKIFQAHLDAVINKYMANFLKDWRAYWEVPSDYKVREFGFMKLTDIHLAPEIEWYQTSDPKYAWILGGIAILILMIACINYVSLALTTSVARRVEIGIRKVVGAQRSQVAWQFTVESLLLAIGSLLIGLTLVAVFLPYFNAFTGKHILLSWTSAGSITGIALLITVIVGLLAGSYPAVFLSRFLPVAVLKGRFTSRLQAGFTKPLVVFQFFLSASMIICSVVMYRQMVYMTTKDLGFDQSQVVVIPMQTGWTPASSQATAQFRQALKGNRDVLSVAGTTAAFGHGWSRFGFKAKGANRDYFLYGADDEYISLLEIDLIEGRNFDASRVADSTAVIVNEALVRDMKWEHPLEEHLNWKEDSTSLGAKVIGVMKDYHFQSLESKIEPMFISMDYGYNSTALVKLSAGDPAEKIEMLRGVWKKLFPDRPFEFSFLDDDLNRQYHRHEQWSKIMGLSTIFAIVIACLGLFGLAGINAVNRTKEIGIRKVMGADLPSMFVLLNRQYVWLAVIAFSLATPVAWYAMHWWLQSFTFAITLRWQLFAGSMLAGLAIALVTVSYHTFRVAWINPAETLKHE